jgi:hypothetical protein
MVKLGDTVYVDGKIGEVIRIHSTNQVLVDHGNRYCSPDGRGRFCTYDSDKFFKKITKNQKLQPI